MNDRHLSPIVRGSSVPAPQTYQPGGVGPAGGGWSDPEEGEGGAGIRRYLGALYRGKWVILAAALVGAGVGYLHTVRTVVIPEYSAQGALWIQGNGAAGAQGPIVTSGLLEATSWRDLLVSFAVLDPVVLEHQLYIRPNNPEDLAHFAGLEMGETAIGGNYFLRPTPDRSAFYLYLDGQVVEQVPAGAPVGTAMGFVWPIPEEVLREGREIAFRLSSPRDAARALQQSLMAEMDARGTFIRVGLVDRDPARAAGVINSTMEQFVQLAAELKSGNLEAEADLLQQQLLASQDELGQAEQALEGFRIQTITLPSDQPTSVQAGAGLEMTRGPVFNEYFQLSEMQGDLQRDRERIDALLAAIPTRGLEFEAVEFIPAAARSAQFQEARGTLLGARSELRTLSDRYTAEHPLVVEVQERIDRIEQVTIPAILTELAAQIRAEETDVSRRLTSSQANLSEIPARTIQEARLRRNVDISSDLYTELRRRYAAASMARASSLPDVRVLDWALTPSNPVNADPVGIAMVIFLGFLGAAVGAILLRDLVDTRVRTPDEVMTAFRLPILGAIPKIRGGPAERSGKVGIRNLGPVREAFRQLRTNLEYAYGAAGPMMLTVSSSGMNEGKTLVTTNLGVSFAELGLRTIIVDGDTRRGDLHHFLGCERSPGLTDFLMSRASQDEVIQSTGHAGLDVITSGVRVSHSPELLSSRRMSDLLATLRASYDVVLFDSPPLGAGADPLVLGSITGNMLFVIRAGATDRDFAQAKMEPLERLPIRQIGIVMNDYVPDRISAYRHYGSYLPGYEASEEVRPVSDERLVTAGAGAGVGAGGNS